MQFAKAPERRIFMAPEEKEYQVIVAPGAYDRMYEQFDFLAQVNKAAAERLLQKMLKDLRSLEHSVAAGMPYERPYTPVGKYRYLLCAKRYRIVFMVEGSKVFVDDIQDCREDDDKSILPEE